MDSPLRRGCGADNTVHICFNYNWPSGNYGTLLKHEMVHVQQQCDGAGKITDKNCEKRETEAHRTSCEASQAAKKIGPGAGALMKCVKCGVKASCPDLKLYQDIECTWAILERHLRPAADSW